MDAALLLIAANESCPQPQTSEHLAAVEIMKLQHIIILQNKVDLVKEASALAQQEDIQRFITGTVAENSPVIPISAQLRYNIEVIAEYMDKKASSALFAFARPRQTCCVRRWRWRLHAAAGAGAAARLHV